MNHNQKNNKKNN